MQPLTELTVCEGDIAQLEVKFSQENVEGSWMKNGKAVAASDRVHIVIDKQIHKLLIEDTHKDDLGMYSFVVPDQEISTSAKLIVQSKKSSDTFCLMARILKSETLETNHFISLQPSVSSSH